MEQDTSTRILEIARDILATRGLAALSFDAVAKRLGRSKQAVLYWYPSKSDLLAALFVPCLSKEADAAEDAVRSATGRSDAIRSYVRGIAAFHIADLDRFRLMYLLPQTIRPTGQSGTDAKMLEKVHPVTDRIYAVLASHLYGDPAKARAEAVAIHSSVLGLVAMIGLADSLNDPMKQTSQELIEALIRAFRAE